VGVLLATLFPQQVLTASRPHYPPAYSTSGTGSLSYKITGTPTSAGTASFADRSIGGQSCMLNIPVSLPVCRAESSYNRVQELHVS
jgi:hypothetical protein